MAKTTLDRAFELADHGIALPDIRRALVREGCDLGPLQGSSVTIQLGRRILAAKLQGNKTAVPPG
jgi:hypothetical protein